MKQEYGRLRLLRRKAIELQNQFLEELCYDGEVIDDEPKLSRSFSFFLWEIDEAIRAENREKGKVKS